MEPSYAAPDKMCLQFVTLSETIEIRVVSLHAIMPNQPGGGVHALVTDRGLGVPSVTGMVVCLNGSYREGICEVLRKKQHHCLRVYATRAV